MNQNSNKYLAFTSEYLRFAAALFVLAGFIIAPAYSFASGSTSADYPGGFHTATTSFNNDSQDKSTLRVSNYSANPDSSTAWSNSIQNVRAGDVVSFVFYYHNTGSATAKDTRAAISFSYGSANIVATGKISASNASAVYGTSVIYPSGSAQGLSLSFSSAQWYPNQNSVTSQPLPAGQNGSEVATASGVSLGDIAPGWNTQGYLVVRFTVNGGAGTTNTNETNNALCVSIDAPSTINAGQSFTANITMHNSGTKVWDGNYRLGSQDPQDNLNWGLSRVYLPGHWVYPGNDVLFTFTATAPSVAGTYSFDWKMVEENVEWFGTACTKTIVVGSSQPQSQADFSVALSPSGTQTVVKPGQLTYTVYVNAANGYSNPVTLSFISTQGGLFGSFGSQTVSPGGSTTLFVTMPSNTPDGIQNALVRGSAADGKVHDASLDVNVTSGSGQATLIIMPNSQSIQVGQTAQFYAAYDPDGPNGAQSAQEVTFSSNWSSAQPNVANGFSYSSSGQFIGNAQGTTAIFAAYNGLTATAFLTVNSNNNNNNYGGAPFVQTDSAGNVSDVSAAVNGEVNPNNSQTSYRFEYGTTPSLGSVTAFNFIGFGNAAQNVSASLTGLSTNTTYYFRVVAQNDFGTSYGQTLNFTTGGNFTITDQNLPFVVTNTATFVGKNSGLLNGMVRPNSMKGSAWFEYGTSQSLGSLTAEQVLSTGDLLTKYAYALSGLSANTTYYYRAVAQNEFGTVYGALLSFRTNPAVATITAAPPSPPQAVFVTNTIQASGEPCVTLLPSVSSPEVKSGQEFDYSITYRNNCEFALKDAELTVIMPKELTLRSTNFPFSIADANTRTYHLGVVAKGFQGTITIRNTVNATVQKGDTLLYGATLTFKDNKNKTQSVSAYINVLVTAASLLGLSAALFLLGDLGWSWLLIFLLAGFLIYWFYFRKKIQNGTPFVPIAK